MWQKVEPSWNLTQIILWPHYAIEIEIFLQSAAGFQDMNIFFINEIQNMVSWS